VANLSTIGLKDKERYICKEARNLSVDLKMEPFKERAVGLGNLYFYCRKNGEVEVGAWKNNVLI
jgi:hypothetical protein